MVKRKIILLVAGIAILSVTDLISMSNGALNMTGAPGEGNCTGCHGGTANSNTNGNIQLSIKGNPTEYEPGKTYEVTVTTSFAGRSRFGFGLAARKEGVEFLPIGELSAEANSGLKVSTEFVTHSVSSNTGSGSKTWTFNWKAPQTNAGKITLYAAGVAGNQNETPNDDFVYTTLAVLKAPGSTGLLAQAQKLNTKIYPTIQSTSFWLECFTKESNQLQVELYSLGGQLVEVLASEQVAAGDVRMELNYRAPHPTGIYVIKTTLGQTVGYQKVVLQ